MNWLERLDVIALALMLAYVVLVLIRVCRGYDSVRRAKANDTTRNLRKLTAELCIEVGNLNSVASTAPYLGLVGTCVGILSVFRGFGMARGAAVEMVTSEVAVAFVSTAAGILVALPATWSYNHFRTRIESLQREISSAVEENRGDFRFAQRLPLRARLSSLPFAVIAAPAMAIIVAVFTTFSSFHTARGFVIELASVCCEYADKNPFVVVSMTDGGKLFLNQKQEDWNSLAGRFAEIYGMQVRPIVYLSVDDGVRFQTVADAIDIAKNTPVTGRSSRLNIAVRLITRRAMNARCPEPAVSQHVLFMKNRHYTH